MPLEQSEQKTIVPTLVIGVGGTGLEVITRIRRLVIESYENLDNLPILGFLHIDTEANYKIKNPNMAGPPLEPYEKFWARVKYDEAAAIVANDQGFSWYHEWLPPELKPGQLVSEDGAGQIRACGRFSFFYNRDQIRNKCHEVRNRIANLDQITIGDDTLTVQPKLNIFVVGSISGGTGSGMLIDLGYCLRDWFQGEKSLELTAIIPSPDAFVGIGAGLRLKENGYAALMELNYYSDANTEFSVKYGPTENSRITETRPPYDFIYIVGTQNELVTLKIDTIREMIAQNIFLDLVSDYAPYKRSVRDNIRSQIGAVTDQPINQQAEPIGRSYPRNFLSFGIATIEIPIHQIRKYLSALLAADLYQWWLNNTLTLPSDMDKEIEQELKDMKLLSNQLTGEILISPDGRRYEQVIQQWIKSIETDIVTQQRLQCTAQLPNVPPFAQEKGKILEFVSVYLQPKVEQYKLDNLRDDQRGKGIFIQRMNDNVTQLISTVATNLQEKVYNYLTDRNRGQKFLKRMLEIIKVKLTSQIEQLDREASRTWEVAEKARLGEYNKALSKIEEFRTRWTATKEDFMKKECDTALQNLYQALAAGLQRQSRQLAAQVLRDLLGTIQQLNIQLDRWIGQVKSSEAKYRDLATQEENQADVLEFVGLKLFDRLELKELYDDFLKASGGQDVLLTQLTERVIQRSNQSKFWRQSQYAAYPFRLLDVEKINDLQYPEFEKVVANITGRSIKEAPANSKLAQDLDACTRFTKLYPNPTERRREIELLFQRSKPLVRLDNNIPQGRFQYVEVHQAGVIGGENTTEIAAQQQVRILKGFFTQQNAIAPLTNRERHKILAVHEIGGFSLRCITGTAILRQEYQKWRGELIRAERARLKGQNVVLPVPVHIQKEMIFWDLIPSDPNIEKLVLIARAFGILKEEINKNTQKNVICYRKPSQLGEDIITLATTWEDTIQVLELPDCRDDKQEVQRQLNQLLEKADTDPQKQQLWQKLAKFLAERLQTVYRQTGQNNPLYLRERTIIQEFIIQKKLGTRTDASPTVVEASKPHCSKCGKTLSLSDRFCIKCGNPVS